MVEVVIIPAMVEVVIIAAWSKLYLVPADLQCIDSFLLDEDALVVLIQQCDCRVENLLPKFNIGLSGAHLDLVYLSPTLFQDKLEGWSATLRLFPQWISSQDEDKVSVFCFEDGGVEVELYPTVERNGRPLFSF